MRCTMPGRGAACRLQAVPVPFTTRTSLARVTPIMAAQATKTVSSKTVSNTSSRSTAGSRTRRGTVKGREDEGEEGKPQRALSKAYTFITGFPFPLGPVFKRDTVRREVVRDQVWVFDQTQALEDFSVYTPVRMTVIKLASGGLWVHSPVAPTEECIALVEELGCPVEYLVLGTFAYEHKVFLGPFSRRFPDAEIYVTPYQWSFPLNLPLQFFGISATGELSPTEEGMPWEDEIGQRLLLPPSIGVGEYARQSECAFFHKRSKTLIVTDAVVMLNDNVPAIIPVPALLESARDSWLNRFRAGNRTREEIKEIADPSPREDTQEARVRGWRRMSLLVLYFNPANLLEPDASWEAIKDRLICPPVVETLVYTKFKSTVREWVDTIVADWQFTSVIPAHFDAPVRTNPAEFKRAFAFAYEDLEEEVVAPPPAPAGPAGFLAKLFGGQAAGAPGGKLTRPVIFPEDDIATLRGLNSLLVKSGLVKEVN